jgi:gamma-glutamyltranspeptidase/glutathione hydrolase
MAFTSRPTLRGTFGMVSSTHWLGSSTAMAVLEAGGNAFDAAVAAAFVLHLAEPHLNGPGGDLPAIIATAADPRPRVLAGQGPAPAGATSAHFRSLGLDLVPGAGPLAAVVPGSVDAWLILLRDEGTLRPREVLRFALEYAGGGVPLSPQAVGTIAAVADLFRDDWTTSADLWLPEGAVPVAGTLFRNAVWARTLGRLLADGESAGADRVAQIEAIRLSWREGFVAEAIEQFQRRPFRDSSGERHAGVLTATDLASWAPTWEQPATFRWRDFDIAKTGPWASGPVLLQALALLDAASPDGVPDPGTAAGAHVVVESLKLALADREAWYGDGFETPLEALLSPAYSAARAALITDRSSLEFRPGSPDGRTPAVARLASASFTGGDDPAVEAPRGELAGTGGEPTVAASGVTRGDTVHLDVVDHWGNMISATPSGGWLQSSPTIPELGFCLGSRLQMTWVEDGLASSLRPGRRPRTTLSPTLISRDGEPVLACGTPGGDQQDQWQLLFLLRHLGLGQDLQEAIDAPAWHTDAFPASFHPRSAEPGSLLVEDRLGAAVFDDLAARGHRITRAGSWTLGRLCAVARDPATGMLSAAANPRGMQGYAAGR